MASDAPQEAQTILQVAACSPSCAGSHFISIVPPHAQGLFSIGHPLSDIEGPYHTLADMPTLFFYYESVRVLREAGDP